MPACRRGYMCLGGQCVSECNPPCPGTLECWQGACIAADAAADLALSDVTREKSRYVGGGIGVRFGARANDENGGTRNGAFISAEVGGKYVGFELNASFADSVGSIAPMFAFHIPIVLSQQIHLYLEPGMAVGPEFQRSTFNRMDWEYNWSDSRWSVSPRITQRVRLRWDPLPSVSVWFDPCSIDILPLTAYSAGDNNDYVRVYWNFGFAAAFRY